VRRALRVAAAVIAVVLIAVAGLVGYSHYRHHHLKATGPTSLPRLATERGIAMGAEYVQSRRNQSYVRAMVKDNFTSITPNQSFKWAFIEPEQGQFDFGDSDAIVKFARDNHLRIRGCCLAWGATNAGTNPAWLLQGKWTKAQLLDILHTYITTVVSRYKGVVAQWDVVNEGLRPSRGSFSLAGTFWGRVIGPEYVADAFRWAHEADPDAQLYYNEYGAEGPSPKFDAEFAMVKKLKVDGVPINGVGLQMHRPLLVNPPYYPTPKQVQTVLRSFQAIGINTELTELDQPLRLPATRPQLQLQGTVYQQMTSSCLAVSSCTGVTVWGVDDNDRYEQLRSNNLGAATLFSTTGRPKAAFRHVILALTDAPGPARLERESPGAPA
jgi:endo-1,4-beta-xylanase